MIRALREAQRKDLVACADGLGAWLRGEESLAAEAAGLNVAETYAMHHRWLETQLKG